MNIRKFFHFDELPSTNTHAAEWVRSDAFCAEYLPAVFVARRQTAGRGRGGKTWVSPEGCLMFSLVFGEETLGASRVGLAALAAALAVRDTVMEVLAQTGVTSIGIHWPNDVCWREKKLAGILLERLACGVCVLGIGLNVRNSYRDAPEEVRDRMFSLADIVRSVSPTGRSVSPKLTVSLGETDLPAILHLLLSHLALRFAQLTQNPASLVAEVESHCVQLNAHTTLLTPRGEVSGMCTGLAPDGGIIIDGKVFYSGEVTHI